MEKNNEEQQQFQDYLKKQQQLVIDQLTAMKLVAEQIEQLKEAYNEAIERLEMSEEASLN